MATIKSYSDLQQSKKLAEILPLESADMYYSHEFVNSAGDYYKLNIASEGYFDDEEFSGSDIPAWSLAALLGVLPKIDASEPMIEKVYYASKPKERYICTYSLDKMSNEYDNPVDACYEMILKLHELKML